MSEFFLEIYSEEIPARMQNVSIYTQFKVDFEKILKKYNIYNSNITIFSSPVRMVFYIDDLENTIKTEKKIIKGPKISANQNAIEGFAKKYQITSERLDKDGEFYVYTQKTKNENTKDLLPQILNECFAVWRAIWPMTMRWNDDLEWIRPVRNLICFFDNEKVQLSRFGIESNDIAIGHKFSENNKKKIHSYKEYRDFVYSEGIILNAFQYKLDNHRYDIIRKELKNYWGSIANVVWETSGLCEIPTKTLCQIDKQFLELPTGITTCIMTQHQKYIPIIDLNEKYDGRFYVVVDRKIENKEQEDSIRKGNLKVIHARLADGLFFYKKDLSTSIETLENRLKKVVFHAKLGSVHDRIEKIKQIASNVSLNGQNMFNLNDINKTINLMKLDLATEIVGELPEWQGIIGALYFDCNFKNAIKYQYVNVTDIIEKTELEQRLRIQFTLEEIVILISNWLEYALSLVSVGEIPTSSRDPFGIDRCLNNVTELLFESDLIEDFDVKINQYYQETIKWFEKKLNNIIRKKLDTKSEINIYSIYQIHKKNSLIDVKLIRKLNEIIIKHTDLIVQSEALIKRINSFPKISSRFEIKNPQMIEILNSENLSEITSKTNDFIDNNMILSENENIKNENLTFLAKIAEKLQKLYLKL